MNADGVTVVFQHWYLYGVLVNKLNKAEATAEAERRRPPTQATVEVRGQAMPIGAALDVSTAAPLRPRRRRRLAQGRELDGAQDESRHRG